MSAPDLALRVEHGLLGAEFSEDARAIPVRSYLGGTEAELGALTEGGKAGLCDLSGLFVQLVEGGSVSRFVHVACSGALPDPGGVRFGAVLAGDGATVAVPLVMRTGTNECVLLDGTPRAEILAPWLSFLVGIGNDGDIPFADIRLTDASGVHVPLMLMGDAAPAVLADYLPAGSGPPEEGSVASLSLDGRIQVVGVRVPLSSSGTSCLCQPCYLLLVPPSHARVLWRSLLSFPSVVPAGRQALYASLTPALPWLARVDVGDRVVLSSADLHAWGLTRNADDFVGAQALSASPGRAAAPPASPSATMRGRSHEVRDQRT